MARDALSTLPLRPDQMHDGLIFLDESVHVHDPAADGLL